MMEQSHSISLSSESAILPVERASLWHRFVAFAIDAIILSFAGGCLDLAGGWILTPVSNEPAQGWWALAWGIITVAVPAIYFLWPYSTSGQTPGKRALKIKVISIDGSALNWRKGLLRSLGYVLSGIPFGLGFLWATWDHDKQAGHDKIAGTCVVPVSTAREQLQGRIEPAEVRRRQKRWLVGLGIPAALVMLGIFLWIQRGVAEVRAMGPWPGIEVSAEEIARVDLSQLGLEVDQIQDARDEESWAGGGYEEGVLITYESGGERVVAVWALRYESKGTAGNDYNSAQAWAGSLGTCGMSSYARWGNSGVVRCWFGGGYDKILWNDTWIVDIVALEGTEFTPELLADQVRDAIAVHWKGMAGP